MCLRYTETIRSKSLLVMIKVYCVWWIIVNGCHSPGVICQNFEAHSSPGKQVLSKVLSKDGKSF